MITGLGFTIDYTSRSDYSVNIKKADEALKYFYNVYKKFNPSMSYDVLKKYFLNLNPGFMYYLGKDTLIAEKSKVNIRAIMENLANTSKGTLPPTSKDTQDFNLAYQADMTSSIKMWSRAITQGLTDTWNQAKSIFLFGILPAILLGGSAYIYFFYIKSLRKNKNQNKNPLKLVFKGDKK